MEITEEIGRSRGKNPSEMKTRRRTAEPSRMEEVDKGNEECRTQSDPIKEKRISQKKKLLEAYKIEILLISEESENFNLVGSKLDVVERGWVLDSSFITFPSKVTGNKPFNLF